MCHAHRVHIKDPEFVVRQSGRERVLREGKKNVHAFVRGEATCFTDFEYEKCPTLDSIRYNPYKYAGFVRMPDEKLVHSADRAYMQVSDGRPSIHAKGVND